MPSRSNRNTHLIAGAAIALLLIVGIIHFMDAPGSYDDAPYKGLLFLANGIAACVAAWGIYKESRSWGWTLGLLVAGGAFVGYIVSRTIGLPGLEVDTWDEPLGTLSLITEGLFALIYVVAIVRPMLRWSTLMQTPAQTRVES